MGRRCTYLTSCDHVIDSENDMMTMFECIKRVLHIKKYVPTYSMVYGEAEGVKRGNDDEN